MQDHEGRGREGGVLCIGGFAVKVTVAEGSHHVCLRGVELIIEPLRLRK